MSSPRQIAYFALRDVHKGAFVDVALDRILQKFTQKSDQKLELSDIPKEPFHDRDRRLVTELVYGCVRRQRTLDAIIDEIGKKKAHQQPKDLRTILHLGLYQLRYQERIPPSAAVNTTVELAKEFGFAKLTGVVNGMLRQYIRMSEGEEREFSFPFATQSITERLGIIHSFPDWIIDVWIQQFGLEETEKLCEWMNQTPTIDLRVNPLRSSVEEVEQAFADAGIALEKIPYLPQALRLVGSSGAIKNLPGFNEGWWTVQDSSAQLVGYLLDPQPGEVIIDACAAPGGKATHIAELMQDKGKIWACDKTASRLSKIEQNAERSQLKSIQTLSADSRNLPQFQNTADRVLLDVPCSGLGTLHRHADARWRQTPESVEELAKLQQELLLSTSKLVKPGGVLVYSTCTLHPVENENVIESFLITNPDWKIEPPSSNSPVVNYCVNNCNEQGWLKVLPHQHNMDGFFMVRLRKANTSP
ncbi:16S rRNA (cytosine(967)-C(5))-methyltransferase [Brunnivagina elsteri]|uniref:16S rRNA (cytosine(967)-C(5))-methyltransferase n=1 Tax=Brunnivagina elsteri CCALA 953 TaxID=987040 RepID=A0A2A2TGN7_9CYAN|nr:16S rRNA (cytosine(967)-C(5))-methyltransferase [Calothrix elsteri]PAX52910.1 16S rRNA (cytosine(967)-C(5))-methyltransferase [Calothrix elsteri CCALA 953]